FIDDPFAYTPSYSLIFPSDLERTFLSAPNVGTVTVRGTPGDDTITISVGPTGALLANVNGTETSHRGDRVTSVRIMAGAGNDTINIQTAIGGLYVNCGAGDNTINIESLPRGISATIDGSPGNDEFNFSPVLGDLNNIQSSVNIDGGGPSPHS